MSPRGSKRLPREPQEGSRGSPDSSKSPSELSKRLPRALQERPRAFQEASKRLPSCQDSSKSAPRRPRIDFGAVLQPFGGRFASRFGAIFSAESRAESREQSRAERTPRDFQETCKRPPRAPNTLPRSFHEVSKTFPEALQMLPRAFQETSDCSARSGARRAPERAPLYMNATLKQGFHHETLCKQRFHHIT